LALAFKGQLLRPETQLHCSDRTSKIPDSKRKQLKGKLVFPRHSFLVNDFISEDSSSYPKHVSQDKIIVGQQISVLCNLRENLLTYPLGITSLL